MTRPSRTARTLLFAVGLALGAGCQSGPTAADYLQDAHEAARDQRYEEAETFAELAAENGADERETRILHAKIERDRAIEALDADEQQRAFKRFVRAGEIDPRRVTSSRYFRKAVEIGQRFGMHSEELAPVAQKAVEADPSSVKARRLAAKLWDESGNYDKAVESYLWIWQSDPSRVQIGHRLAAIYRMLDRPTDAISVLERIVERDPDNPQAKVNLAALYSEHGAADRARNLYESLLEQYPDKAGILLRYSRFLKRQGEIERANTLRQRALDEMPGQRRRKMRDLQ